MKTSLFPLLLLACQLAWAQAPKPAVAAAKAKPSGKYTCSFFAGTLQNVPGFTLADGGRFTDHSGSGTWDWDAASGTVSFKGAAWNGQRAKVTGEGRMQVLKPNGSRGAVSCSRANK